MALVDKRFRGTPTLRSHPREQDSRHATWFELFHDLAFVAIISQITHRLGEQPTWAELRTFALIFGTVWWLWVGETFYSTRFDADNDYVHRALQSVQLLALAVMAATIDQAWGDESRIFAGMYALVRGVLILQYVRAGYHVPKAQPLVRRFTFGFGLGMSFWIASMFVPLEWRLLLWFFGLLADALTSLFSRNLHLDFPPHVTHLPERFGLFTILVLGEIIIGSVSGLTAISWEWNGLFAALGGILIAIGVWWIYFDRLDDEAVRKLGDPGTTWLYQLWLYAHLPLVLSLAILSIAVDHSVHDPLSSHGAPTLLAGSIVMYLVSESLICFTAIGSGQAHPSFSTGVAMRLSMGALLGVIVWVFHVNALTTVGLAVAALLAIIIQEQFTPQPEPPPEDDSADSNEIPMEEG